MFPEFRKACIARYLLCKADEKYAAGVKREARDLDLPMDDGRELGRLAESTDELLWTGMTPFKGVYVKSFMLERDGRRRPRVVFAVDGGAALKPVSPVKIKFPKGKDYGCPVWIYSDSDQDRTILGVTMRNEAEPWDVLPAVEVTYYGLGRGGQCQFADGKREYAARGDVVKASCMRLGYAYRLRYATRDADGKTILDVCAVEDVGRTAGDIGTCEGVVRIMGQDGGPAFVGNVFVPPDILHRLRDSGVDISAPMFVKYVRISPQDKVDRFGRRHHKERRCAIYCEALYGEELERFLSERKDR